MNRICDFTLLGPLMGLVFLLGGCSEFVTGSVDAEEHDDHLEHHMPPHRPPGFTEAVDQIQMRYQRMRKNLSSKTQLSDEAIQEFLDILGWLPEIAADSDMRRKNWEQVDAVSVELTETFQKWQAVDFQDQTTLIDSLNSCVNQLKDLRGTETPVE